MTDSGHGSLASIVAQQEVANAAVSEKCRQHLRMSLAWTALYLEGGLHSHCDVLLKGGYGTAVEAVSLLSFGLVRPAVLSLRSHYELSLQFLYYKDHPVEWKAVQMYRDQPNLPGVTKKYLKDYSSDFEDRFKKLTICKTRQNEDCYGVLSGIAHGTAINSITTATQPHELIESAAVVESATNVFLEVAENISDIYVSSFPSNWLSVPTLVRESLNIRFGDKQPSAILKM